MQKLIIFGAGPTGKRLLQEYKALFDVVAFCDNDRQKWGCLIECIPVISPSEIPTIEYDRILVASVQGFRQITNQLMEMGIVGENIMLGLRDAIPYFIKNFARDAHDRGLEGAVAEVGVFQGKTAKYINAFFPDRKLYLFDTFTGFAGTDVMIDREKGYSQAREGDFLDTSVDLVLSAMPNRDMVVVRKGYFPETAVNIKDNFILARLDVDLYAPTMAGLQFFSSRMAPDGLILVHDYYTESYSGVKAAVDEFMDLCGNPNLIRLPAGDMLSCVIAGFR